MIPGSLYIRQHFSKDISPIVVFVWFRETARNLQNELTKNIDNEGLNTIKDRNNRSGLRCEVLSGDITKNKVN